MSDAESKVLTAQRLDELLRKLEEIEEDSAKLQSKISKRSKAVQDQIAEVVRLSKA